MTAGAPNVRERYGNSRLGVALADNKSPTEWRMHCERAGHKVACSTFALWTCTAGRACDNHVELRPSIWQRPARPRGGRARPAFKDAIAEVPFDGRSPSRSFVAVSALKLAKSGHDAVLRSYEAHGSRRPVCLLLQAGPVWEGRATTNRQGTVPAGTIHSVGCPVMSAIRS